MSASAVSHRRSSDLGAARRAHVQLQRAAAAPERAGGQPVERPGRLELVDAHDLGAEVGEQHAGERHRPDRRQLDDTRTAQRSGHSTLQCLAS